MKRLNDYREKFVKKQNFKEKNILIDSKEVEDELYCKIKSPVGS